MFIEHVAIRVKNIEKMRSFYQKYFNCISNEKYTNKAKQFESYFLVFENGARLELIKTPDTAEDFKKNTGQSPGFNHIAIRIGDKDSVDKLTEKIQKDGYTILEKPRETGDGYYESSILDPEHNRIEIIA
ncbi:MAG TPA: VOC family protein [Exilispira sp.]|nr:VOC family protein [Exilispira sp.]